MGYNGYTEKKKKTNQSYIENNNLVQLKITITEDKKKEIVQSAYNKGMSMTQFIIESCDKNK